MSEQVESTTETSENSHTEPPARENTAPELNRLVELSIQYPEIGPPLAELASKIGHPAIAKRIVKMGLDSDSHGVEYYYVGAHNARREQRFEDTLKLVIEAVQTFVKAEPGSTDKQDAQRLLHLVRLGFSTLMFELRDLDAHKGFAAEVAAGLSQLEEQLGKDAFYRTLLAQALWFDDRERSEEQWSAAEALGSPEATWNARGTWYREAERDLEKAEQAYRRGLEEMPQSALINHNLAQVLLDRAETLEDEKQKRTALNAADKYLRAALKGFSPKGLRRHIHTTRDRMFALRETLPASSRRRGGGGGESPRREPPNPGDKLTGKVRTVASYGAFVQLPSGHTGLLHKSELAHEHVHDAADKVNEGDELEVVVLELSRDDKDRLRISLSRKALLDPPPAGANASAEERPAGRGGKRPAKAKNGAGRPPRGGGGGRKRGEGRGNRDRDRDHASSGGGRDRDHGGGGRRESDAKRQEKQEKLASLGEMLLAKISGGDDAKE